MYSADSLLTLQAVATSIISTSGITTVLSFPRNLDSRRVLYSSHGRHYGENHPRRPLPNEPYLLIGPPLSRM